ncbi:MAG: endonuclease MutS2 [Clostridiales Family XIII bacterium]|nr:endonuclease MutS2 [Clostridiales Family XIII bacterium]
MSEKVREYAVLGYYSVLDGLEKKTVSQVAARMAGGLLPGRYVKEIQLRQQETAEAVSVLMRAGAPPFPATDDLSDPVSHAARGGVLGFSRLREIAFFLRSVSAVKTFLQKGKEREGDSSAGFIADTAGVLITADKLSSRILRAVVSDTELADDASPALKRIRGEIASHKAKIKKQLARYTSATSYEDILMDKLVTLRNGRYVLPVKAEQQGRFPGIVHDRSKGGATVFVEPQAVVDLGNMLTATEAEEREEIERIAAELSLEVGKSASDIISDQQTVSLLDFIFAKGALAYEMDAVEPEVSEDGAIEITNGRNPLIGRGKVVPVSIRLGGSEKILIVTGPNTGGKTVTLKTVGLLTLMAQAGLHVPASAAVFPLTDRVFADIGDEQSIEQSLSTFSAHMKNIVEVMNMSTEKSLVLLDELGAGTDPAEGAALAIALLEGLRKRGALVMATTHYSELKKYAAANDGIETASLEFDLTTLSPTFRLLMGALGKSNAFAIAEKLGIDSSVIAEASRYLSSEEVAFDEVISGIEADRQKGERARAEAERLFAEAEAAETRRKGLLAEVEKGREKMLRNIRKKAEAELEETEYYAEEVRKELKALLKKARKIGDAISVEKLEAASLELAESSNLIQDEKRKLKKIQVSRHAQNSRNQTEGRALTASRIHIGDIVRVVGTDLVGEVAALPNEAGKLTVQIGQMKMSTSMDSLEDASSEAYKLDRESSRGYGKIVTGKMGAVNASIDLHGKNLDEAEMLVEKYLDDAVLARLHEVVINHGRGEGILREGIRRLLKANRHVSKYRTGYFDEGGDGVTVVTLSRR